MRALRPSFCVFVLLGPWLGGCGSSPATGATNDSGLVGEAGVLVDASTPTEVGLQPDTISCTGDAGACLSGTAKADQFVTVTELKASLYRVFPSGTLPKVVAEQPVAKDSTWAFSGLATWAHYYVVFVPGFPKSAGVSRTVATRVGPLAVPHASAASIDVLVKPAQLDVLENSVTGGPLQVQGASARLFDPATGDEIGSGGTVSISIGTASTRMPWTPSTPCAPPPCGAYEVQFTTSADAAAPPPAQPSYQIVSSLTSGAAPTTWNLVADPPRFAGAIASPAPGATIIPAGKALTVTWPSPGAADYEIVDLFQRNQGSWSRVYTSPTPVAPDQSSETIPGLIIAQPGMYLLGVSFTKANCPTTADGCVEASTEASELLTVQ